MLRGKDAQNRQTLSLPFGYFILAQVRNYGYGHALKPEGVMKDLFSKLWHFAPGPLLARDLTVALALKGVLLLTLYLLFFGPAHRPPSDAAATAATLIGANEPKESQ